MRGYTVHLLFHLLAIVVGSACGVAAGLWWFGGNPAGLWLCLSALVVGVVVLVLQTLYIGVSEPPSRQAPSRQAAKQRHQPSPDAHPALRTNTRPDLEPVRPNQPEPTSSDDSQTDEETKRSATAALNEHWSSRPSTGRT